MLQPWPAGRAIPPLRIQAVLGRGCALVSLHLMGAEGWGLATLVPLPSRYSAFRQRSSTFICPIYLTRLWHFYFRKRGKHKGVLVTFGNPESWFSTRWGSHMPEAVLCHRRHLTQLWSVRNGDHQAPTPWLSAGRVRWNGIHLPQPWAQQLSMGMVKNYLKRKEKKERRA